jgi:carboxymethylenebutenolidase
MKAFGDRASRAAGIGAVVAVSMLTIWSVSAFASSSTLTVGVHRRMEATLIAPDGPGPYPGVLVLHTSSGLRQADLDYARKLAERGYVCLVPAFMEAYGITAKTRAQTFTSHGRDVYEDFVAAVDALRRSDKVKGSKIAAVGFSNGGYFAMWLAATGKVDAGVSYYGALTAAGTDKELTRFSSTFERGSSPVLILHGYADGTVPVAAAQRLEKIVKSGGSPYEIQLYRDVDHAFDRALRNDATKAAASDAWDRTQAFLAKWLGRP